MSEDDELDSSQAPLTVHLEELRQRLWRSVIAVGIAGILCYGCHDALFDALTRPLFYALKQQGFETSVTFRTLSGAFLFHFKTAMVCGLFVASPVIFYQLWRFIAPGLYANEKKGVCVISAASSLCFVGGACFAYFMVLPDVYTFLLGYSVLDGGAMQMRPDINIEEYLGFTMKLLCAFAIAFEMPVVVVLLSWVGICTYRTFLKYARYATLLCFVMGALLTPPDVVSQLMLALPMLGLYFVSIGFSYVVTRRRERRQGV